MNKILKNSWKKVIVALVLLVVAVLLIYLYKPSYIDKSHKCAADSDCSTGSYCSGFGACLKDTCGDGTCSAEEKSKNSCPTDCGCTQGEILNKHTNQCQPTIVISSDLVTTTANTYLSQNNITGKIVSTVDTYYGNQALKEVVVDCAIQGDKYPCQIILYVDSSGKIVNVSRTS